VPLPGGLHPPEKKLTRSFGNPAESTLSLSHSSRGLILTLGDPNGLGPELVSRLVPGFSLPVPLLLIGPEQPLRFHCRKLGIAPFWKTLDTPQPLPRTANVVLYTPPTIRNAGFDPGKATPEGGRCAGESLEAALAMLQSSKGLSLVTGPLNKAMLREAGFPFPGHTEFLAERSGVGSAGVCMHLCGPRLRVSLATTHPPLREVPGQITLLRLMVCMRLTCGFVKALGFPGPVAVCGLNPHAGEGGTIGREEVEIIEPAVRQAQCEGLEVEGPFPADTVFHQATQGRFSAVLAMYHDQGLGPLKLLHFGDAVNVTLGLPFVRTSVDHGTGYDLVGKGIAATSSLKRALELAIALSADASQPACSTKG
jgi:4-hydroxythreonine-4-phosphate dehydrogenase